jgi:hypothetical protein
MVVEKATMKNETTNSFQPKNFEIFLRDSTKKLLDQNKRKKEDRKIIMKTIKSIFI